MTPVVVYLDPACDLDIQREEIRRLDCSPVEEHIGNREAAVESAKLLGVEFVEANNNSNQDVDTALRHAEVLGITGPIPLARFLTEKTGQKWTAGRIKRYLAGTGGKNAE